MKNQGFRGFTVNFRAFSVVFGGFSVEFGSKQDIEGKMMPNHSFCIRFICLQFKNIT